MYRTTLGDIRPVIAKVLGCCETDSRIPTYVNEAMQRLQPKGKWVGLWQQYRICINDSCITWPRQIETIEAVAICQTPGIVRNDWFEFIQNGPGLQRSGDGIGAQLLDRGMACTFDDPDNTTTKLRIYCDNTSDLGKEITVEGLDENGNEILQADGTAGETMVLAAPYVQSTKYFWKITAVRKDITLGYVRMYGYDTDALSSTSFAVYEPSETRPLYRRSKISGISQMGTCCNSSSSSSSDSCSKKSVTVMAKLRYIPVISDLDWLVLGNVPAIKDMVQSIKFAEDEFIQQSQVYEARAVNELQKELSSYQGDGEVIAMRVQDRMTFGAGGIANLIGGNIGGYW